MFQAPFGTPTSTPFGQSTFGKPATTGFSAPVFGSTGGTSLFGTTQPSGGLFGTTNPAPAFGQPQTTQPTFGGGFSSGTTSTGLFGGGATAGGTTGGLFGSGAAGGAGTTGGGFTKPGGFGTFGSTGTTASGSGLFGQTQPQQTTSLFGQPSAQSTTGLFGSTFGAAQGGTTIKFTPVTGSDTMIKNGVSTTISTRHHCITCMKEYESKSLEELRLEDYAANRKGPQQGAQTPGSLFGTGTGQNPLFSSNTNNTSGFGTGTSSVFGTGGTTGATSLFGKPAASATPAFGSTATTTSTTFGFNSSSNLFGNNTNQVKPFGSTTTGTGLFGTTSQPSTGFGTQSTGFGGFGTPQQSGGLFSQNKPAFSLGGPTGTSGFSFSTPASSTPSLFGTKPGGTGFGTFTSSAPTTAFSTTPAAGSSLFGNTNFKGPTSTTGFNFGQPSTTNTLGSGLTLGGTGSSLFSNTANKPGGLFSSTNTTGLFGNNTFGTSTPSMFGSTLGTGTNFSLGGANTNLMSAGNMVSNVQPQTNNTINQHMLALASMPFGDSPLFKNLMPASGKTDELIKPTSPAAQKALISGQNFKISPKSTSKIKVKPVGVHDLTKKSLFDGLESENENQTNSMIRPSPKRLVLRPRPFDFSNRSIGNGTTGNILDSPSLSPLSIPRNRDETERENNIDLHRNKFSTEKPKEKKLPPKKSLDAANSLPDNTMVELRPQLQQTNISAPPNAGSIVANSSPAVTSSSSCPNPTENSGSSNIHDQQSSSSSSGDSEGEEGGEHPTGIVLRRIGYYTIPPLEELVNLMDSEGHCIVDNFTIGRLNYGNIFYPDSFDVANLNIDEIVHIRHKEVVVYPDDDRKPAVGSGLNQRAQVTLDRVWPLDKTTRLPVSDPSRIAALDYETKLRAACAKHGSRFVEYRPQTGSWVFKVDHFSKYGLTDSDEEDSPPVVAPPTSTAAGEGKKLKIISMDQLKAPTPPSLPFGQKISNGLGLHPGAHLFIGEEDEEMEDGITTPFDLDDEMERGTALSPTSKLARQLGSSAHKVQLMKASFFDQDEYNLDGDFIDYEPVHEINGGYMNEYGSAATLYESQKLSGLPLYRNEYMGLVHDGHESGMFQDGGEMGEVMKDEEEAMEESPPIDVEAIRPVYYALKHQREVVTWLKSSAGKLSARVLADMCITKGRSLKVGWGLRSQLLTLTTVSNEVPTTLGLPELDNILIGREENDMSAPLLQRLHIRGGEVVLPELSFQESIEGQLEVALGESNIQLNGETMVPELVASAGVGGLVGHFEIAQALSKRWPDEPMIRFSAQVWGLCVALWGDLPDCELPESHSCVMSRRQAVSEWLQDVVADSVTNELGLCGQDDPSSIFIHLTGYKIAEACMKAQQIGDLQLSLVLSQGGGRELLSRQLEEWRETGADKWVDRDRIKAVMLAAGLPIHKASDGLVNTCLGLDWIRAFAVHLWYVCPLSASVTDALLAYETSFKSKEEGGKSYATAPIPPYCNNDSGVILETSGDVSIRHLCYHILKLYSVRSHPLEGLLNPATYTLDPLDYRVSWLLMRVLGCIGYKHVSKYTASLIHTSFASQLESHGLWHWAVFILLHLEDPYGRAEAIRELIGRHITLDTNCQKEKFLREQLIIPNTWIFEAKATRAISEKKYQEAADYLIKAENWNHAHSVIMEHISAKAIVNEKYDYLEGLLRAIGNSEEKWKQVGGWSSGGKIILAYLEVVRAEKILAGSSPFPLLVEELQPSLAELCSNIKLLPTRTPLDRLCQAEMAKRSSNFVQSVVSVCHEEEADREVLETLTQLVSQLPLPSDYATQEWQALLTSWTHAVPSS